MKKLLFLSLTLGLFLSFTTNSNAIKSGTPKEAKVTVKAFEKAVKSHDQQGIMTLMDPEYVKEQHDEFLEGRTEQFIDELFCGMVVNSDKQFKCMPLNSIKKIKLSSIDMEANPANVSFHVTSDEFEIIMEIGMTSIQVDGKTVYRFYGAMG